MSASEVMSETVYRSEPQAQGGDYRPAVILQVLPELDAGGVERGTVDIARAIVEGGGKALVARSEEHTSELQSHHDLVCRLLLEKKKKQKEKIYRSEESNTTRL